MSNERDDDVTVLLSDDAKQMMFDEKLKEELEKRITNRALWLAEKQKADAYPKPISGG